MIEAPSVIGFVCLFLVFLVLSKSSIQHHDLEHEHSRLREPFFDKAPFDIAVKAQGFI